MSPVHVIFQHSTAKTTGSFCKFIENRKESALFICAKYYLTHASVKHTVDLPGRSFLFY